MSLLLLVPTIASKILSSRGFVLDYKVNETLHNLLKAFEAYLKMDTKIPPKLKDYPNSIQKKVNLAKHHALIHDTSAMFEGLHS